MRLCRKCGAKLASANEADVCFCHPEHPNHAVSSAAQQASEDDCLPEQETMSSWSKVEEKGRLGRERRGR